jgi:hypothetical protein
VLHERGAHVEVCDNNPWCGITAFVLTLTPAGQSLDRRCLSTEGAFCWWYGDVIDGEGNGVVVIGAFALPFLEHRGAPTTPSLRPSINVALYERGICTFYALQELSARDPGLARADEQDDALQEACTWLPADPDRGLGERYRFGKTTLGYDVVAGKGLFFADIDIKTPVGHLRGRLDIAGPVRDPSGHSPHTLGTPPALPPGVSDGVVHDWSPQLGPSKAKATLDADGRAVVIDGGGYHDRNGALVPMWEQGIARWLWARADVAVAGRVESRIVYALWPAPKEEGGGGDVCALGVVTDDAGATRTVDVVISEDDVATTWLGMREVRAFSVTERDGTPFFSGRVAHKVDDGPFYLRHTLKAGVDAAGDAVCGFVEVVDVEKIDRPWQRPFVRMRVSPPVDSGRPASLWHPLFAGSNTGRVARQLRWLVGRR